MATNAFDWRNQPSQLCGKLQAESQKMIKAASLPRPPQNFTFGKNYQVNKATYNAMHVNQFTLDGVFVRQFPSVRHAAVAAGVTDNTIRRALDDNRPRGGFLWKRVT